MADPADSPWNGTCVDTFMEEYLKRRFGPAGPPIPWPAGQQDTLGGPLEQIRFINRYLDELRPGDQMVLVKKKVKGQERSEPDRLHYAVALEAAGTMFLIRARSHVGHVNDGVRRVEQQPGHAIFGQMGEDGFETKFHFEWEWTKYDVWRMPS